MERKLEKRISRGDAEKKKRTLEVMGVVGVKEVRANIENQTAPSGSRWTPSIRAAEEGGQTLRKSGSLWKSIDWSELNDSTVVVFVNAARFRR
jgi:hypothetical protein